MKIPIQTLKVGSLGVHNCLGLAKAKNARILIASTSEVYGDPLIHPQNESYWGNVNPIGPRACYDEGKRVAEALCIAYKNFNDIQSMHLTSGSTGFPKLINLSFQNFISSVEQWHEEIKLFKSDRYIQCLPLNHIAGLSILIRSQLKGFETILMDKFDSKKINSEIDNGANLISLIPSMVRRLLDNRSGRSFPKSLKGIIIGGDNCSENLIKELISYNVPIYKVYGMTESCSGVCGFWVNKYPEMLNSVGKPFKQTKIKIQLNLNTLILYLCVTLTKVSNLLRYLPL